MPTRDLELELGRSYRIVGGMDEVGRGAVAGPVVVGLAVVDATCQDFPTGLTDSKLLTPARRQALVGPCQEWARGVFLGEASAAEIDAWGIIAALRLAGRRALKAADEDGLFPDFVILDGKHNWLNTPAASLFSDPAHPDLDPDLPVAPPSMTVIKGDRSVAVCAAASVVAKVSRDTQMAELPDPGYGWSTNKGYLSRSHREGLTRLGASPWHRRSWKLGLKEKTDE